MVAHRGERTSEDAFFNELASAYGKTRQAFARHVGMTLPRLQVLMLLWKTGGTSHDDLRRTLSLDGASVTRVVKEFEAEGFLSRRPDPGDNRYVLARLTPAGERAAAELDRKHRGYQRTLLDGISPRDRQVLRRVLARLEANIDGADDDRPGPQSATRLPNRSRTDDR